MDSQQDPKPLVGIGALVAFTALRAVQSDASASARAVGIPGIAMRHNTEESESQLHHSKGIGLWLVTWIVEEGGGRLDSETDPDDEFGTVVTVTLPAA